MPFDLPDRETPVHGSVATWERFLTDVHWLDIEAALRVQIERLRDDLETMGKGFELADIAHTQGELFALRTLVQLPHIIIDELKIEAEHGKERTGREAD